MKEHLNTEKDLGAPSSFNMKLNEAIRVVLIFLVVLFALFLAGRVHSANTAFRILSPEEVTNAAHAIVIVGAPLTVVSNVGGSLTITNTPMFSGYVTNFIAGVVTQQLLYTNGWLVSVTELP